ncbi:MAG: hypothetical protein AAGG48_32115, partial [Planctomycetota bacterium]
RKCTGVISPRLILASEEAANHRMQRRTGGQFLRMDAQLPVPADPGRSVAEVDFQECLTLRFSPPP